MMRNEDSLAKLKNNENLAVNGLPISQYDIDEAQIKEWLGFYYNFDNEKQLNWLVGWLARFLSAIT